MIDEAIVTLRKQLEEELGENILKFWLEKSPDNVNGGFYGYISNDLRADAEHDRSSVLNCRILWTFSAAYRLYGDKKYLDLAARAYDYITSRFIDSVYSGVYWMLDCKGNAVNPKKQIYAAAFAIYGLTEYYMAAGNEESLSHAVKLFEALEANAHDDVDKGYVEALARDWTQLEDMSLSIRDMNAAKSMNTHLHILEAYTNLLRVWDSELLRSRLKELIKVFTDYIIDSKTAAFKLFFDMDWSCKSVADSYGHDIEGSWLIHEAAEVLGDAELLAKIRGLSVRMAAWVYENGYDHEYGGIFNERGEGRKLDDDKDWWPQAEAVVGFYNAYRLSGEARYLEAALKTWNFIRSHIVDKVNGEWFWGVSRDGSAVRGDEKAGPWKCPYHNSRMCFEIIRRTDEDK
jgi:mannobiose 2-epimerase